MAFVIGVDASTSAVKAVAFDAQGTQLALGRKKIPLSEPRPGWAEQAAPDWSDALYDALRQLGEQVDLKDAIGLAITCQRETIAIVDENYDEVRPAITWVDTRCGDQVDRFAPLGIQDISGKPAGASDALFELIWLKENEPESLQQAATVVDTAGYLIHELTGERATSFATAATTTLVDISTRQYSDTLMGFAGIERSQLSELVDSMQLGGRVSERAAGLSGLPVGLPVIATLGDGQAAGLGAGVVDGDTGYISLGTGIAVGAASDRYVQDPAFRTLEGHSPGYYFLEPVMATGSYLITWFVKTFGIVGEDGLTPEQTIGRAAERVPAGSDGLMCLPYWGGVLSPYWDDRASGIFLGLRGTHGQPEMYRAVLEGLSYEIKICLDLVEKARGKELAELVVVGGGAQSALWDQIIADVCGRPVIVCDQTEISALGAAMHAAAATGLRPRESIEQVAKAMTSRGRRFEPDVATSSRYGAWFDTYKVIYSANKPIFDRIAGR